MTSGAQKAPPREQEKVTEQVEDTSETLRVMIRKRQEEM